MSPIALQNDHSEILYMYAKFYVSTNNIFRKINKCSKSKLSILSVTRKFTDHARSLHCVQQSIFMEVHQECIAICAQYIMNGYFARLIISRLVFQAYVPYFFTLLRIEYIEAHLAVNDRVIMVTRVSG